MTNEEMKKTIEFMLEHQAKFDTKQELIQEDLKTLTGIVTSLAMQVEADHQITKNSITRLEDQANKDREEMRLAVTQMSNTVDKLSNTVDKLIGAMVSMHTRVSHLEDKAS